MEIRKAKRGDIPAILELLQLRIQWMDEKGLYQWNKTDYLGVYPYEHFENLMKQDVLFVAVEQTLVGVMALLKEDPRWPNHVKTRYVHHLATHTDYKGLGVTMLKFAEELVIAEGGNVLRLDCQTVNAELNRYYEDLGYICVGTCIDGAYEGNLMEKPLKKGNGI
jgi:GNAT superfamily N-acetyltransferase